MRRNKRCYPKIVLTNDLAPTRSNPRPRKDKDMTSPKIGAMIQRIAPAVLTLAMMALVAGFATVSLIA